MPTTNQSLHSGLRAIPLDSQLQPSVRSGRKFSLIRNGRLTSYAESFLVVSAIFGIVGATCLLAVAQYGDSRASQAKLIP